MTRENPKPEEYWQHQNGDIYKIYGIAKAGSGEMSYKGELQFAAVLEADLSPVLICKFKEQLYLVDSSLEEYKPLKVSYVLYYKEDFPFRVWARTLEDFMGEKEGAPRFRTVFRAWRHKKVTGSWTGKNYIALHYDGKLYSYENKNDKNPLWLSSVSLSSCEYFVKEGSWEEFYVTE